MCVILNCVEKAPDKDILRFCELTNRDGGGVAWRDRVKNVNVYKKGLKSEEIADIIKDLPLPYVIHFRIGTAGGKVNELCHPFEISVNSELNKECETPNNLLFHNGHISEYTLLNKLFKINLRGHVSDSRILASLLAKTGLKTIRHFANGNKFIIMGKKTLMIGDWKQKDGIYYSNLNWEPIKINNHFNPQQYYHYDSWENDYRDQHYHPYTPHLSKRQRKKHKNSYIVVNGKSMLYEDYLKLLAEERKMKAQNYALSCCI